MALGRRKPKQQPLWLCRDEIVTGQAHPFYQKLNQVLAEEEFDAWLEELCAPYFAAKKGRPSIPPGVYFRMLFIGYLIHAAAYNLGILMRSRFGYGTPKGMAGRPGGFFFPVWLLVLAFIALLSARSRRFSTLLVGELPFAFQRKPCAG